jgi:hypothetical protein
MPLLHPKGGEADIEDAQTKNTAQRCFPFPGYVQLRYKIKWYGEEHQIGRNIPGGCEYHVVVKTGALCYDIGLGTTVID